MSRHQPVCELRGLFPRFCFFDPDVLYNLENENELLAPMDIDHPVRNSTKNTVIKREVSEEVSNENTEPSRNINKQRFANMSTAEIGTLSIDDEDVNENVRKQ